MYHVYSVHTTRMCNNTYMYVLHLHGDTYAYTTYMRFILQLIPCSPVVVVPVILDRLTYQYLSVRLQVAMLYSKLKAKLYVYC